MPVYEWQREKPLRADGREVVTEGDTFRAPEKVGESFSDLVEEQEDTGQSVGAEIRFARNGGGVEEVDTPDNADETEGEGESDLPADDEEDLPDPDEVDDDVDDLVDGTVDEVEEGLESGAFDDRLDQVLAAERAGRNRKGVRDAVRERRRS